MPPPRAQIAQEEFLHAPVRCLIGGVQRHANRLCAEFAYLLRIQRPDRLLYTHQTFEHDLKIPQITYKLFKSCPACCDIGVSAPRSRKTIFNCSCHAVFTPTRSTKISGSK